MPALSHNLPLARTVSPSSIHSYRHALSLQAPSSCRAFCTPPSTAGQDIRKHQAARLPYSSPSSAPFCIAHSIPYSNPHSTPYATPYTRLYHQPIFQARCHQPIFRAPLHPIVHSLLHPLIESLLHSLGHFLPCCLFRSFLIRSTSASIHSISMRRRFLRSHAVLHA